MKTTSNRLRMSPTRPIAPSRVPRTEPGKPAPTHDQNQDAQIRSLQERVAALEDTLTMLSSHISVNNLNELVIQANHNIFIQTNGSLQISTGSTTKISAPRIDLAAPIAVSSGVVQTQTIIADTVVGKSYTPGAGNIW